MDYSLPEISLKDFCNMSESDIRGIFHQYTHTLGNSGYYIHIPRGGSVLGISHLDYVSTGDTVPFGMSGNIVSTPRLDNRLGAWLIYSVFPKIGINCDVLFTTNEEIGMSTAEFFESEISYNWIFSFDRGGQDVVMYDYYDSKSRKMLESLGFKVGYGSFSDIAFLDIGIKGFNFGNGIVGQHLPTCHVDLKNTQKMVELFKLFHAENESNKLSHSPNKSYHRGKFDDWQYAYNDWKSESYFWDDSDDDETWGEICESCREFLEDDDDILSIDIFGYCLKCADNFGMLRGA